MNAIHLTLPVNPDRTITVPLPADVVPEAKEVSVVVMIDYSNHPPRKPPLQIETIDVGIVDPSFTYRREDLYGDDGR